MQWLQDGRFLSLLASWSVSIEKFLQLVKNQERLVLILCVWSVDFPTRNVRVCSNVMTSLTAISLEVIIGGTYCRDVKVGADLPPSLLFQGSGVSMVVGLSVKRYWLFWIPSLLYKTSRIDSEFLKWFWHIIFIRNSDAI